MSKNKQAKLARQAALAAAQASSYKVGTGHFFGSQVGCRWPTDIGELGDRIQQAPGTVSDRDRDLVAKMLPLGSVTRRDGKSIAPVMNSDRV